MPNLRLAAKTFAACFVDSPDQQWYNYKTDILEAEKELTSDLRRATDREDRWDAWDEWETEVIDADKDYVKEMREKGYRTGRVTVGG